MNPNEVQLRLLMAEGRVPEPTLRQAAEAAGADGAMDLGGLLHHHGFLDADRLAQLRRQTAHTLAGLAAMPAGTQDSGPPVRRPASERAAAIRDSTARSGDDSDPELPPLEPAWPTTGSAHRPAPPTASGQPASGQPASGQPASGSAFPTAAPGSGPSSSRLPIRPRDPLADYEIGETLGSGGMGTVYAARHPRFGEVALKVLKPGHGTRSDRHVARFQREIEVVRSLKHPNIVPLLDAAVLPDRAFIAMPRLGESLEERLQRAGPLSIREGLTLTAALARALAAAHFADVLHRDMKPANVLFDERGRPYLADFGLALVVDDDEARLSRTGETLGTLAYMPPEQLDADREKVDVRADIYALGATLYEMLTGRPPFVEQTQTELFVKIAGVRAPTLRDSGVRAPQEVEDLVARCLEKEPDARWPTAEFLADACDELLLLDLESEPVTSGRAVGRALLVVALVGLLLGVGVVGRGLLLDRQRAARRAELDAELTELEPTLTELERAALAEGRGAISAVRLDRAAAVCETLSRSIAALSPDDLADQLVQDRLRDFRRRLSALRALGSKDASVAAEELEVTTAGEPGPAERWLLARAELAGGRIDAAAGHFLVLAQAHPEAVGMIEEAGRDLLEGGRPESALKVLEAADGDLAAGRFRRDQLRVRALTAVGRTRSAEALWRETLATAPRTAEALDRLLDTAVEFGSLDLLAELDQSVRGTPREATSRLASDRQSDGERRDRTEPGDAHPMSPAARLFLEAVDGTVWGYPCQVLALIPELKSRSQGHSGRLAWLPVIEAVADARHEKVDQAIDRLRRFYQAARRSERLRLAAYLTETLLPALESEERHAEVDEICGGLIARLSARLASRKDEARWCRRAIAELRTFRADCALERAALRVFERGRGSLSAGDSAARADYRAALELYDLPLARRRLALLTVLGGGKAEETRALLGPLATDEHPNTLYARAALLRPPGEIQVGAELSEAVERAYSVARYGLHDMIPARDLTTLHVWLGSVKRNLRGDARRRLRPKVVRALLGDPFAISGLVCAAEICLLDRARPAFEAFARRAGRIDPLDLRLHQLFKDIDSTSRWKQRLSWLGGLRRAEGSERVEIINALGQIHLKLGETKEAERAYRRALSLDPHHPAVLSDLRILAERRGDSREAKRLAERLQAVQESLRAAPAIQAAFVIKQFEEVREAVSRHRGRVPRRLERTLAFFDAGARLMAEPNKDEHWLGFERFVPEQVGFSSCFYTACSIGSAEVHRRRLEALRRELVEAPCDRMSRFTLRHAALLHEYALAIRTGTLSRAQVESIRRRLGAIRALQPDMRGSWGAGVLTEIHAGAWEDAAVDCDRLIKTIRAEPEAGSAELFSGLKALCLLHLGDRPRALESLMTALDQGFTPEVTHRLGLTDNPAFRELLEEAHRRR